MSGAIECWGDNGYGQTDAPVGRYSAVSTGWSRTCGLRDSGEIKCWGNDATGLVDAIQTPEGVFTAVSTGGRSCGLRESGEVSCWGFKQWGPDAPPGDFSAISVGGFYGCGLRKSGELECWRWAWAREQRASTLVDEDPPAGRFRAVSAGIDFACGLRESGEIACWGFDYADRAEEPPPGQFNTISAGRYHACALTEEGAATCWMVYNGVADVPAWLRQPSAAPTATAAASGQIVARRLADGRTEFGWLPAGGERVLPQQRYFPVTAQVDRWLRSSAIELHGVEIGRIEARLLPDGRIEFVFTPTGGQRILPPSRYFPADAAIGRWLRSAEIELGE